MAVDLAHIPGSNPRLPVDGKRLRAARKRAGLTLKQLAERSGKNYVDLWKLEMKAQGATLKVLAKLAVSLGVTVEYLTGKSDFYAVAVKVPGVPGGVQVEVTEGKAPRMTIRFPPNQLMAAEYWLVHHWLHVGYWRQLLLGLPDSVLSPPYKPHEFETGELRVFMDHMSAALEIILRPGRRIDLAGVQRLMRLHYRRPPALTAKPGKRRKSPITTETP